MHLPIRLHLSSHVLRTTLLSCGLLAAPTVGAEPTAATGTTAAVSATDVIAAVRRAADAYATAFNAGDDKAIGDQWTLGAELEEGGGMLKGRDAIVASLKQWRATHPKAALKIDVTDVQTLGRHDPCVGIRATPVAEAMLLLVLMDHALRHRAQCGDVRVTAPPIPGSLA